MTLKDLKNVISPDQCVVITSLGYFKESKGYYSFRTVIYKEDIKSADDEYLLSLELKALRFDPVKNTVWIDLIEWI